MEAKEAGAWIYGAEAGAPAPHTQADLTGKVVLVLGGEGKGLRRRVAETCDLLVSIPVRGQRRLAQRLRGRGRAPVRGAAPARGRV